MTLPFTKLRARHLRVGTAGENAACRLLKAKGMDVLARNYKCPRGEIDIVARDGASLVFVEVKTRSLSSGSRPAAGLRSKQMDRIRRAGFTYIRELDNPHLKFRFDLIEVVYSGWSIVELRQWEDHFNSRTLRYTRD